MLKADVMSLNLYAGVSEWFKELVLKTSDSARGRGFESHRQRQITKSAFGGCCYEVHVC